MANYTHTKVKLQGTDYAKANADKLVLVVAPTKADTYVTFTGKVIAESPLALGDWFSAADGVDPEAQRVTTNAKATIDPSGVAASNQDLCVAAIDSVAEEVLIVQDATDRVTTNETGDEVTIPGLNILLPEMVAE